jgi:hypothetical protein
MLSIKKTQKIYVVFKTLRTKTLINLKWFKLIFIDGDLE